MFQKLRFLKRLSDVEARLAAIGTGRAGQSIEPVVRIEGLEERIEAQSVRTEDRFAEGVKALMEHASQTTFCRLCGSVLFARAGFTNAPVLMERRQDKGLLQIVACYWCEGTASRLGFHASRADITPSADPQPSAAAATEASA
jgi:hypothetical protein